MRGVGRINYPIELPPQRLSQPYIRSLPSPFQMREDRQHPYMTENRDCIGRSQHLLATGPRGATREPPRISTFLHLRLFAELCGPKRLECLRLCNIKILPTAHYIKTNAPFLSTFETKRFISCSFSVSYKMHSRLHGVVKRKAIFQIP